MCTMILFSGAFLLCFYGGIIEQTPVKSRGFFQVIHGVYSTFAH